MTHRVPCVAACFFSLVTLTAIANAAAPQAVSGQVATTPAGSFTRPTPPWFDSAKLGIFVHWNAASIPAFAPVTSVKALSADNERNSKSDPLWELRKLPYAEMYQQAMMVPNSATARYHAEHFGTMPYDGFVTQFRDRMIPAWDPKPWGTFFARTGARYVVFSTKTEDGFLMWPSTHRNPRKQGWQSTRDAVGDVAAAVRGAGLRFGVYYCGSPDWTFGGLTPGTDTPVTEEYRAYVDAHWRELIERYRPEVLWSDGAYPGGPDSGATELDPPVRRHIEDLLRFYMTRVPEGVVNNRFATAAQNAGTLHRDFSTPEYSVDRNGDIPERTRNYPLKWEANRGMGTSYGYNAMEDEGSYMTSGELIRMFVNVVAWGGNLLINIGPTATGEIPWSQARPLLELGWWLSTNGDAIYGTHRWQRVAGITDTGIDVRYTATDEAVFAILLRTPKTRTVELDLRLDPRTAVTLQGWSGNLKWSATPSGGARIELPMLLDERPAWSLRLSPATGVQPF